MPAAPWMSSTDRYGIPGRLFGSVPEDIYGLIGQQPILPIEQLPRSNRSSPVSDILGGR
jgi:hypothetical protein